MNQNELKALVSLLDEESEENLHLVERKIQSLGEEIIPFLEEEWDNNLNPEVQTKIEDLIHTAQFSSLKRHFKKWSLNEEPDVLEGMYLCARYNYPNLKLSELKVQIRELALEAAEFHDNSIHPYEQIRAFNRFFFNKVKFKPNRKDFHNPRNSFLNIVLESHFGNPLTLSILYMLVAQQLGIPVYGVNFPNLFILTYKGVDSQFYINVHNNGLIFTKSDVDDYLVQLKLPSEKRFYQPCTTPEIIARNLRNLITAYTKGNSKARAKEIETLLSLF